LDPGVDFVVEEKTRVEVHTPRISVVLAWSVYPPRFRRSFVVTPPHPTFPSFSERRPGSSETLEILGATWHVQTDVTGREDAVERREG
jgi:hypothetical protein